MKRYKLDFKEENLSCWNCGAECDNAVLIEWQRGFTKEILCDRCLGEVIRNEKQIKILADIRV